MQGSEGSRLEGETISTQQANMMLGQSDGGVFVKIAGPATMTLSAGFTALCDECRSRYQRPIFVDLSGCDWLDSTFAGCLVGQTVKARNADGPGFSLVRPSDTCCNVLTNMGLAPLLLADLPPAPPAPESFSQVTTQTFSAERVTETVIDAHEHLADVSQTNREVFGRVADTFRADLERKRKSNP